MSRGWWIDDTFLYIKSKDIPRPWNLEKGHSKLVSLSLVCSSLITTVMTITRSPTKALRFTFHGYPEIDSSQCYGFAVAYTATIKLCDSMIHFFTSHDKTYELMHVDFAAWLWLYTGVPPRPSYIILGISPPFPKNKCESPFYIACRTPLGLSSC